MAITAQQKEWLNELATLLGSLPAEPTQDDAAGLTDGDPRVAGQQKLVGGLIPGIPDIKSITTRITIKNKSGVGLRIVQGSPSLENLTASFVRPPPVEIAAGNDGEFTITNEPSFPIPFPTGGTGGRVKYDVLGDEKKAQLFMKWERGGIAPSRKTTQQITPADDRFKLEGFNTGGDDFEFFFTSKGGTLPPGPGPAPGPDVRSNCLITIVNETGQPLTRAEAEHERGDFLVPPPRTVPPNDVVNFVSVETPNAKEQGCKGFIVWEVGSPVLAVWRIEWDNPEGAKNDSKATLTPQTAGFRSQDVIGQGEENVPVSFTLSGGTPGPLPPGPEKEPEFNPPPVESKQPTLRKGDKSKDGWVEYAQTLLNFHLKTGLAVDGDFAGGTLAAVLRFQKEKSLQVDGTIGNQTWAALREGAPEKPSTDGRKPHTFVEEGAEARWTLESKNSNRYLKVEDLFELAIRSVGDKPLDPKIEATLRISPPGGRPRAVKIKIGEHRSGSNSEGFIHVVSMPKFRKDFPSVPVDASVTEYLVEAFLPQELGGDFYSGKIRE